jgi:TAG lipase / lysophosphatidylethanolamine acyltransferase
MRNLLIGGRLNYSELGNDLWRQNPINNHYDYKLIYSRLQGLLEAQESGDAQGLIYIIRSGMPS